MTIANSTLVINNVADVYSFVAKCGKLKCANEIIAHNNTVRTPCTSILGMFALDPSLPFVIDYPITKETEWFREYIAKFEVEE